MVRKCKPKPCRECKTIFQPRNSLQVVCGLQCAVQRSERKNKEKVAIGIKKKRKAQKQANTRAKQALKTKSDYVKEVQVVFNRFIRLRDEGKACISCGVFPSVTVKRGGNVDAGHYRSRGSAPELRFCEDNCFSQCKKCNRQLSGNIVEMRKGIIDRIGLERLEVVEGHHKPKKYTIDDLKELKKIYQDKCNQLKRG